jgi:hypothetical protein
MNAILGLIFYPLLSNRSFQVLLYDLPRPTFLPQVHYRLNDYLEFEVTYGTLQGLLWLAYYYILDPLAAVRLIQICHHRRSHPLIVTGPLHTPSDFVYLDRKCLCSEG